MKYYESHYEEYIQSVEKINLHPELVPILNQFPQKINQLENLIIYGPAGTGKYSQILSLLKKYSPSALKYDKKIVAITEKQQYIYRISDIHYEIDMSLLGCNSKILWHEVFFQIIDIISVKPNKIGIILCKNFHLIHAELLEIFYSYMQQYNHSQTNIKIIFCLMMEHISFLPTPIINACHILRVQRPDKELYEQIANMNNIEGDYDKTEQSFLQHITNYKNNQMTSFFNIPNNNILLVEPIIKEIALESIQNIKELRSFPLISSSEEIPKDIFNIICDNIIQEMTTPNALSFTLFRDKLYDMLTYNLDMTECLWYILRHFIEKGCLTDKDTSDILTKTYTFLKYYNNNYRPIYHLESIMFYIINKLNNYNEL